MHSRVRVMLDGAIRAREFLRAHPFTGSVHPGLVVQLKESLAQAESLAAQEETGRLEAQAAARERKQIRREAQALLAPFLAPLPRVVRRLAGRAAGVKLPSSHASSVTFLTRAWSLVSMAREHRDLLAGHGLAGRALDDLACALTRLEAVTERLNAARLMEAEARAELGSVAGDLTQLLRLVDGLNRSRFQDDPAAIAEWEQVGSGAPAPWTPESDSSALEPAVAA